MTDDRITDIEYRSDAYTPDARADVLELAAEVRRLRELDEHATGYSYGKHGVVRDILFNDWSVHDGMGHHVDNLSKVEAIALAKKESGQ